MILIYLISGSQYYCRNGWNGWDSTIGSWIGESVKLRGFVTSGGDGNHKLNGKWSMRREKLRLARGLMPWAALFFLIKWGGRTGSNNNYITGFGWRIFEYHRAAITPSRDKIRIEWRWTIVGNDFHFWMLVVHFDQFADCRLFFARLKQFDRKQFHGDRCQFDGVVEFRVHWHRRVIVGSDRLSDDVAIRWWFDFTSDTMWNDNRFGIITTTES